MGEVLKRFILDYFPKLGRHFLKASEVAGCKKSFLYCGRDGGDHDCNYFRILFSLGVGKIFWSPAAPGPTDLLSQPIPLL